MRLDELRDGMKVKREREPLEGSFEGGIVLEKDGRFVFRQARHDDERWDLVIDEKLARKLSPANVCPWCGHESESDA